MGSARETIGTPGKLDGKTSKGKQRDAKESKGNQKEAKASEGMQNEINSRSIITTGAAIGKQLETKGKQRKPSEHI